MFYRECEERAYTKDRLDQGPRGCLGQEYGVREGHVMLGYDRWRLVYYNIAILASNS